MEEELIPFEEGEAGLPDLSAPPASLAALGGQETVTVDPETVRQAAAGDRKAFSDLFFQTYPYAFALISPLLRREEDRRDALQETYIQVWQRLPRLRDPAAFLSWLRSIARGCAVDVYHGTEREVPAEESAEETVDAFEGSARETALDVRAVLDSLPEEEARLLVLVYYDGMKLSDIARMQGVPATTVRSRFSRAKKKMLEALKERGIDRSAYSRTGFISTVATAMRDAVGTDLLSAAAAQEILDGALKSDRSPAGSVAQRLLVDRRNKAVIRVAAVVLSLVAALAIVVSALVTWSLQRRDRLPAAALPAQTGESENPFSSGTEEGSGVLTTDIRSLETTGARESAEPTDPASSSAPTESGTATEKETKNDPASSAGGETGTDPVSDPAVTASSTGTPSAPTSTKESPWHVPVFTLPATVPTETTATAAASATAVTTAATAATKTAAAAVTAATAVTAAPATAPATAPTSAPTTASTTAPTTAITTAPTTVTTATTAPTTATTATTATASTQPDGFVPDYRAGHANAVGNVSGNLDTFYSVTEQDRWIYFIPPGGTYLKKYNPDTGEYRTVTTVSSSYLDFGLNVVGDWCYISSENEQTRRVRTDGTGEETLLPGVFSAGMMVREDELYYREDSALKCFDLHTGNSTVVADDATVWDVGEWYLYYQWWGSDLMGNLMRRTESGGWELITGDVEKVIGMDGTRVLCLRRNIGLAIYDLNKGWKILSSDYPAFNYESLYWYVPREGENGFMVQALNGKLNVLDLSDFSSRSVTLSQTQKASDVLFCGDKAIYLQGLSAIYMRSIDGSDEPVRLY